MKLELFKDLYSRNNIPMDQWVEAHSLLEKLEEQQSKDLDDINELELDTLIFFLVDNHLNTVSNFVVLMRYYRLIDRKDLFLHLTKYTGMLGVMENIIKRLENLKGKATAAEIIGDFKTPHLGVHPESLPIYVNQLMMILDRSLESEETEQVLAGNNHSIPRESQLPEKVEYEHSKTLESYLSERHARKVKELEQHLKENKVWFEQIITQEVVDFVKHNQEVLSGVLQNEKLYITKIPYDTLAYLQSTDDIMKKYYGCHCPFAREAIKACNLDISGRFCYCSAGFAKFPFEVILDQKLKVKVLESILMGSDICRFEIDLVGVPYKK